MKKILLSEVNRIHEIMGLKKSLIMEQGQGPAKILFGKLGIDDFEHLVDQLQSVESRMERAFGQTYLEKIKGLFEKEILSIEEREFVVALTIKAFPNTVKTFVKNIEQLTMRNNLSELDGILKLFQNKNIPTIDIAEKVLKQRLGIKMSPESLELWRKYREVDPNRWSGTPTASTTTSSVNATKPTGSTPPQTISQMEPIKPTGSAPMGKIQEPHEFTIEGTNAGYNVYKGSEKNALGDLRGEIYDQPKTYTKESIINGKKVFTYVDKTQVDYVGRSGYASISISLPLETKLTLNDVLPELKSKLSMEQKPGGVMYNRHMKNR